MEKERLKTIWSSIKQRCYNPNNPSYARYGGRGIIMCDKWLNSFESFYNDIGERPSVEYSVDRIDNNGNYEPNNCRWATREEQAKNKEDYKKRRTDKTMKALLISGNTLQEWNINDILVDEIKTSKSKDIDTLIQHEWDNKIGQYCNGMTYLQIEQLDNLYR